MMNTVLSVKISNSLRPLKMDLVVCNIFFPLLFFLNAEYLVKLHLLTVDIPETVRF